MQYTYYNAVCILQDKLKKWINIVVYWHDTILLENKKYILPLNEPSKCIENLIYWFQRDGSTVKSTYVFLEDLNLV